MSCEDLEPFVTLTHSHGVAYGTRHRRDCGTAQRTLDTFGVCMNESEYKQYRRQYGEERFPIPNDHVCMKRWVEHGNEAARRTLHKMGEHDLAKHI